MKKLIKIANLNSFNNINLKGFLKWIIAAVVLGWISGRMNMEMVNGTQNVNLSINSILITLGIYMAFYNPLTNLPQMTRDLPFTSRQQINHAIITFIEYFFCFVVFLLFIYLISNINPFHLTDYSKLPKFNELPGIAANTTFSILYYLITTAAMLPLALIRKSKVWYSVFAGICIVMTGLTLAIINLMPDDKAFVSYHYIFGKITNIPNYNYLLVGMGILALGASLISYLILQKLHAPRRYEMI
jgi:hypothetical protein